MITLLPKRFLVKCEKIHGCVGGGEMAAILHPCQYNITKLSDCQFEIGDGWIFNRVRTPNLCHSQISARKLNENWYGVEVHQPSRMILLIKYWSAGELNDLARDNNLKPYSEIFKPNFWFISLIAS